MTFYIGQYTKDTQISSEIGYGFSICEDSRKLNLYCGYEFDAHTDDELLLGTSVSIGSSLGLDLVRTEKLVAPDSEATKYQFNARLNW